MNRVLSDILNTGTTRSADGYSVLKLRASISPEEGKLLQNLVRQIDPTVSLEVGLAYGVSALFICDALTVREGTQHIVIDPHQHKHRAGWGGIGLTNLQRAGYGHIVRFIEEPSYRALPELERSAQHIDFAFIDGWHTFDFTLVDFFFVDRILNVGGVVVFDDANWPAIRKVCRFVKTNMAYSIAGVVSPDRVSLKRRLMEFLLPRTPIGRLLRPDVNTPDPSIGLGGSCIAFRKDADDGRRWDHFVDF